MEARHGHVQGNLCIGRQARGGATGSGQQPPLVAQQRHALQRLLEKAGFLRRKSSATDGRVVHLSLTSKTTKHLSTLSELHDATNEYLVGQLGENQLIEFTGKVASITKLLAKARLKIAADF